MIVSWEKGPRKVVGNTDAKGRFTPRAGKNGGPVIEQSIVKIMLPKGTS